MSENISLVVSAAQQKLPEGQQQAQQQQQLPNSAQKPRPLGRVRVQGQKAAGQHRKSEDFSVQGEAYSAVEKQSSSSSLPPISSSQQTPQHQRQSSIQSTSSSSPTGDAFRLTRLQQREQELLKKLQDAAAREKLLKEQIDRMEKMLNTAQKLLDDERQARLSTEEQLATSSDSGDKYRQLYEEECRAHQATAQRIEQLQEQHREESARLMEQLDSLKEQLKQAESRHEAELTKLRREHQDALSDRDKRIDNLKRQVAGALGTNSHERQSQIDQLNKELQKMVDEVETLRKRTTAGGGCQQCPSKEAAMRDQGEQIRQLGAICQRFRNQLSEQEQMLIMLLGSKNSTTSGVSKAKR